MMDYDFSKVRGFNYQPSVGSTSYENWIFFDEKIFKKELSDGIRHYPKFNMVRIWLSYEAYAYNKEKFAENFTKAVKICKELNLKMTVCFFNSWHNHFCDNDGVYVDHFIKNSNCFVDEAYYAFPIDIVTRFKDDDTIVVWDVSNEPFGYSDTIEKMWFLVEEENKFLERVAKDIRATGTKAYIGVSLSDYDAKNVLELVSKYTDIALIHTYLQINKVEVDPVGTVKHLEDSVAFAVEFGKRKNMPVLVTETFWGSVDNKERIENLRYNLELLKKYNLGFLGHALYHSPVADLHWLSGGSEQNDIGVMHFVEADGSIRAGHEIFNEY